MLLRYGNFSGPASYKFKKYQTTKYKATKNIIINKYVIHVASSHNIQLQHGVHNKFLVNS